MFCMLFYVIVLFIVTISNVSEFFSLFPTGHGLPAVIIAHKGGVATLHWHWALSQCQYYKYIRVYIYLSLQLFWPLCPMLLHIQVFAWLV
jgi:hypothetical protein